MSSDKDKLEEFEPVYFEDLAKFYADPSDQRTIKQFAEDVGVHPDTIHLFKRKHAEKLYARVEVIRAQYKPIIKNLAYKSLFNRIGKSDLALKLAFQLAGELIERTESTTVYKTIEEKKERLSELLSTLSKKLAPGATSSDLKGIQQPIANTQLTQLNALPAKEGISSEESKEKKQ